LGLGSKVSILLINALAFVLINVIGQISNVVFMSQSMVGGDTLFVKFSMQMSHVVGKTVSSAIVGNDHYHHDDDVVKN